MMRVAIIAVAAAVAVWLMGAFVAWDWAWPSGFMAWLGGLDPLFRLLAAIYGSAAAVIVLAARRSP